MGGGRQGGRDGRADLSRRPEVDYSLLTEKAAFDSLLGTLKGEERIAVDTEFHRERTYFPKVALGPTAWP